MVNRELLNSWLEYFGINRPVLALSLARMADAMGNSILFILIPIYVAKLPHEHISFAVPVMVGILISAFGFFTSFFQPIMGAVTDWFGKRKVMIQCGLAIIALSTLSFIGAENYLHLLLLRLLQGLGVALTIPASLSLMTAITQKKTRGGSMGIFSMFRMIGFAIGPVVGGYLQVTYGFDAAFYAGAAFIALAMVLVYLWVREVPVEKSSDFKERFKWLDLSLVNPGILSASTATFAMAAAFSMVTTLENEINARLDITAFGFSIAFSMLMVGRLIFQVPLGKYSDYIGRKPLILGGLVLMSISTALIGIAQTSTHLIILRLIQGVAAAGIASPAFALTADLSTEGGEGRQMSLITMGFTLGIAIGPLLAGILAVVSYELPFFIIGLICLLDVPLVLRYMPETVQSSRVIFQPQETS